MPKKINPIENQIYIIRGKKVLLDRDLAVLYGVETRNLNKAVKRNIERFPEDFMLQLTEQEASNLMFHFGTSSQGSGLAKNDSGLRYQNGTSKRNLLKSQIVTSSYQHGGARKLPYAFTEQGVAMLSSVLRSKQAILVNIQIMRTFAKIREMLATNKELKDKIEELEQKYDQQFMEIFKAIKLLVSPPKEPPGKIGFRT